ncbi:MAG TPA: type II secretion system protein [Planctomycetota bacterium]|nr:type II secretion system protein [Planctomycetota bacterium]
MIQRRAGFTILELTIALSLIVVLSGLVVVRLSFGSSRQQTIDAARKFGNLIRTYREKAVNEERLYALRFDAATGKYDVFAAPGHALTAESMASALKSGVLAPPLAFGKTVSQTFEIPAPVTLVFNARGLLPDLQIEILNENGSRVMLRPDPLINEVYYDAP